MGERDEAEALAAEIKLKKIAAYEYLKHISRLDKAGLEHSGYRNMTVGEAMLICLKREEQRIEQMIQAFEKKYPI